jgi:S-DNA-T family DNA segregation ATPase FtsK/SpoIIIE
MPKAKPMQVSAATPHPFVKAFPKLAATVLFIAAVIRLAGAIVRHLWPWRRELLTATVLTATWVGLCVALSPRWALLCVAAPAGSALGYRRTRRRWLGWLRCARTRRWLLAGLSNTRSANVEGRLPRIKKLRTTVIGERLVLKLKPGQSHELLEARVEELRAAVRSRDVRLRRDPNRSHLVTVDVVRIDTLAGSTPVAWADHDRDVLSIWEPVHFGLSELGEPIRLCLAERTVLAGGNKGTGKSTFLKLLLAHAAKSPDAELLIIDPNRVHTPWRDRALLFAEHDLDDAIAVLEQVSAEMDRRLSLLPAMPGAPETLTRELSHEFGLPMWLLVIDELAYPLSVAGTAGQQKVFYTLLRDIVARGRAAGIVPVCATQRPTADLIPTSLRDLFDIRVAFRTMTRTASDVILGDDFAKRGFCATDIDLNVRGVNWLFAEGTDPIRTKTTWISPDTRARLAVDTVRHKPTPTAAIPWPRPELEVTP